MYKKLMNSSLLMSVGGSLLASYIRLVKRTSKARYEPENFMANLRVHEPVIMAMWHGQFVMLPTLKPADSPVKAMVARHNDAELIGQAMKRFDVELVRGAGAGDRKKDRGGASALRNSVKALEDGYSIVMTADVPPGPARIVGKGIIRMAKLSGRPIVPTAVASSRYKALNTWSRFTINLPFSNLGYVAGDPIYVAPDADDEACEEARKVVEASLFKVTSKAYAIAGADELGATPSNILPEGTSLPKGLALNAYQKLTALAPLAIPYFLSRRARRGKEDLGRQNERLGRPVIQRPDGKVLWFHAASVGEMNAILPFMHLLSDNRPDLNQLLTTGTVTSAQLAEKRMPEKTIHQYVPVDAPQYVRGFLDHWKPDLAFFTESEIWPNLLLKTGEAGVPLFLLNGTMSRKSFSRWKKRSNMARALFSQFRMILAQNRTMAKRFGKLGARNVQVVGNLKIDAPLLPVDGNILDTLKGEIGDRPLFLAASTHSGEDEVVAKSHKIIRDELSDFLTIIAPRHPERGEDIEEMLSGEGLNVARRSRGDIIKPETDVYLADTIGEMGVFYSLTSVAYMGGSLIAHGGQNPIEAIKLGAGVITGPHWHNFEDSYRELFRLNGAREVISAEIMASTVRELLTDSDKLSEMRKQADGAVRNLSGALNLTLEAIDQYLPGDQAGDFKQTGLRCVS